MKSMIREVLFYIVFLFLLLAVIDGQQDNSSYQQNQNLAYSMTFPGLSNVVSGGIHVDKIWTEKTMTIRYGCSYYMNTEVNGKFVQIITFETALEEICIW